VDDVLVELADFEFGFQVDFVVVHGALSVAFLLAILAHHDDRSLDGGEGREHEVEQNAVRHALAESEIFVELDVRVFRQNFVLAQPFDDIPLKLRQLALLLLQQRFDVEVLELLQVVQAYSAVFIPVAGFSGMIFETTGRTTMGRRSCDGFFSPQIWQACACVSFVLMVVSR